MASALAPRTSLDYGAIVIELESRSMMPDRPLSLEPMRLGLERLQPLRLDPSRVIVVAGTNGKGSVCATLEAVLSSAGARVGLYTSPHLEETTERIRIGGTDITRDAFCLAYVSVRERTDDLGLSHFEMLTLMAIWAFASGEVAPPVEWMILEVGLGGTWDAVNAVPHASAVITSLGLDHENLLGRTLPEIAANKFGVVSSGGLVVHAPFPAEVRALAAEVRSRTGGRWVESAPCSYRVEQGPRFVAETPWGDARLALPGPRGAQNAGVALTVFRELGFDPVRQLGALARVRWPGRMERMPSRAARCPVYLSGDHNPQGVESLLALLPDFPRKRLHLLLGIGRDKDADGILSLLFERLPGAAIYLTETPYRGRALESYAPWLARARGAWAEPCVAFARVAERAGPEDLIVVTGSLYLVGALRRELCA